jgi:hypothetical protein
MLHTQPLDSEISKKLDSHVTVERILAQVESYYSDLKEAYENAEKNLEDDKKRLGELLNRHFFSWWD